jgi:hypothetical protein
MSANPFAALGEDGPNPVAAKGAKFLSFFFLFPGANVNWHFAFVLVGSVERSERRGMQFANAIDARELCARFISV